MKNPDMVEWVQQPIPLPGRHIMEVHRIPRLAGPCPDVSDRLATEAVAHRVSPLLHRMVECEPVEGEKHMVDYVLDFYLLTPAEYRALTKRAYP